MRKLKKTSYQRFQQLVKLIKAEYRRYNCKWQVIWEEITYYDDNNIEYYFTTPVYVYCDYYFTTPLYVYCDYYSNGTHNCPTDIC